MVAINIYFRGFLFLPFNNMFNESKQMSFLYTFYPYVGFVWYSGINNHFVYVSGK